MLMLILTLYHSKCEYKVPVRGKAITILAVTKLAIKYLKYSGDLDSVTKLREFRK